jgi:hypothetical protein
VFHSWLDPDRGDSSWFLAGWRSFADADARYAQGDSFLVAKESVAAFVGGSLPLPKMAHFGADTRPPGRPACIYLAWATYEGKAYRDIVAILVVVVELYSVSITFGSGLMESYKGDTGPQRLHFWLLFVFVAVLRVLLSMPILWRACSHVWTCVQYYDEHVTRLREAEAKAVVLGVPVDEHDRDGRVLWALDRAPAREAGGAGEGSELSEHLNRRCGRGEVGDKV